MNITISHESLSNGFLIEIGFVCIVINTFYPIDQLFLNPFETFSFLTLEGGPLTEFDGWSDTF